MDMTLRHAAALGHRCTLPIIHIILDAKRYRRGQRHMKQCVLTKPAHFWQHGKKHGAKHSHMIRYMPNISPAFDHAHSLTWEEVPGDLNPTPSLTWEEVPGDLPTANGA